MAQVLINIRMDENLKKTMEQTCQLLGMNITTAFTIFAKKMCREQRIPFDVSIDPAYNCETLIDEEVNESDKMLNAAVELAVEHGSISTSLIQRRLKIGYGKAQQLVETMESMGIIGPKPRNLLITKEGV
ncbi:MAG: type II toxin-antitoxin system RelB/DinJ family antitoxin [Oscillospiraceae bacterium]|nr:type II toxin-antitoxin system RelB/DinJ family antitoxin [Oscillospiraceae bacterium]